MSFILTKEPCPNCDHYVFAEDPKEEGFFDCLVCGESVYRDDVEILLPRHIRGESK